LKFWLFRFSDLISFFFYRKPHSNFLFSSYSYGWRDRGGWGELRKIEVGWEGQAGVGVEG